MRNEQLTFETAYLPEVAEPGVSVLLSERVVALKALAQMYGKGNMARGFNTARHISGTRQRLQMRYGDVDAMAKGMLKSAITGYSAREAELMEPLLKADELVGAGFEVPDVETTALVTTIEVRKAIGKGVRAPQRQTTLRGLYDPLNN